MTVLLIGVLGGCGQVQAEISHREEMALLLGKIHDYAATQKPGFGLLPNGGLALYQEEDASFSSRDLMAKINGVLVESVSASADFKKKPFWFQRFIISRNSGVLA